MTSIPFGSSSYERAEGDLPALPVVNMYAEESPTEEGGVVLQSRPPLVDRSASMGSGPVEALYKADGVLSGALFGVSQGKIYKETTSLGLIVGSGPVSMVGNELGLMATAGGALRYYDGATLADVAFPDGANVIKVIEGASRIIALREGSGKVYWTDPLEVDVEATDFATAETAPDNNLDALFIDDILILFGSETVEFWPNTSSATLPFAPLEGRVIERGIKSTGCAASIGGTFAWVTNQNEVCLQDENTIISNTGLQTRIAASVDVRLFTFFIDGVEFLALRIDGETQVWNKRTGAWSEFATDSETNWVAQCHAGGVFGSATDGKTFAWGSDKVDAVAPSGVLERRFRAGAVVNSGGFTVNNLQIRMNPGHTPYLTGDYINPIVEMRMSRDAGQTWGNWRSADMGEQGKYKTKVQWRGLGQASYPAFLAEFRVTDPVPFRVSDVLINEPWGGR